MADIRPPLSGPRPMFVDPRASMMSCNCGLPTCNRPGLHGPTMTPGAHYQLPPGVALPIGAGPLGQIDPAMLYMGSAYGMKESPEIMRSLPQLGAYYPYDSPAAYPYIAGYGGIDARRKNATKESTGTLKAWLFEHRKNPYPTKGEKIMLAIITKMTLTQVSTWFANARRRLKKDHKVTWTTQGDSDDDCDDEIHGNQSGDQSGKSRFSEKDDDQISITSFSDKSEIDVTENTNLSARLNTNIPDNNNSAPRSGKTSPLVTSSNLCSMSPVCADSTTNPVESHNRLLMLAPVGHSQPTRFSPIQMNQSQATIHHRPVMTSSPIPVSHNAPLATPNQSSSTTPKPKIWSIVDVVTSKDDSSSRKDRSEIYSQITSSHRLVSPQVSVPLPVRPFIPKPLTVNLHQV